MRAPSRLLIAVLATVVAGCGSATPTPAPAATGAPGATPAPGATAAPGATPTPGPGATASTPGVPASVSVGQVPGPTWGARAARLADGRVLLFGGAVDINMPTSNPRGAGALFDPVAGTWKATAPAPAGRFEPGVFPGPDGSAIVMGFGDTQTAKPKLAPLLYDPAKDVWRSGATWTPAVYRPGVAVTQLLDGRILVVSGAYSLLYNATADTWTKTDPAPTAMDGMRAVTLTDSRVLVIGGEDDTNKPTNIVRLFDPLAGTWKLAAKMPAAWRLPQLVPMPDGGALALGGPGFGFGVTAAVRYDAKADVWGPLVPLQVARQEPVITALADGRVLVIGGSVSTVNCAAVTGGEVFDPAADAFTPVSGLAVARDASLGTLLADGRVLVALGATAASSAVNRNICELNRFLLDAEVLDPAELAPVALTVTAAPATEAPGLGPFAVSDGPASLGSATAALSDGTALVMGGLTPGPKEQGGFPVASNTVRHVGLDGTITNAAPMLSARTAPAAVTLTDGSVLVVGPDASGFVANKPKGPMAERYDPTTNRWHAVADPGARVGAALVALPGSGAMLIGGVPAAFDKPFAIDVSTLVFDASTEKWLPGRPLPAGVLDPAVTALTDGRVLVAGGIGEAGPVASVFVFDPVAVSWSRLADLPAPRARGQSRLLPDGRVLLIGGYGSDRQLADAVLFDPGAGAWTTTPSFGAAREGTPIVVLADGRVLLAGGTAADGTGSPLASTLVFDPAAGAWSLGPSLATARGYAAAVRVGRIVEVIGGQGVAGRNTPLITREILGGS